MKRRRLAVLPGLRSDRRTLRRVKALVEFLADHVMVGSDIEIVVGVSASEAYDWEDALAAMRRPDGSISARRLAWIDVETEAARRMFQFCQRQVAPSGAELVAVPRDWGWNFADCSHWLVIADERLGAVANIRPTLIYCRDMAARYVPEIVAGDMRDPAWSRLESGYRYWRLVEGVLATDPKIAVDLVSFAGVSRGRVTEVPAIWGPARLPSAPPGRREEKPLVWIVDRSPLHLLDENFLALSYLLDRRPETRVIIAGEHPHALRRAEVFDRLTALDIDLNSLVADALRMRSLRDDVGYYETVGEAAVVWSSVRGGEPEPAAIAAGLGVPFVGADFPQQRHVFKRVGGTAILYDRNGSDGPRRIAAALDEALSLDARPDPCTIHDPDRLAPLYAPALKAFLSDG